MPDCFFCFEIWILKFDFIKEAFNIDDDEISYSLAFNSECVAFAYAADLSTKIYYDENTDEHVAKAKFYAGAGVIDEMGIMVIQNAEAEA